jgi:hypothetical protein
MSAPILQTELGRKYVAERVAALRAKAKTFLIQEDEVCAAWFDALADYIEGKPITDELLLPVVLKEVPHILRRANGELCRCEKCGPATNEGSADILSAVAAIEQIYKGLG